MREMKQSGQIPIKLITYIAGFLFALIAFNFVLNQGINAGIPKEMAYVFAFLALVVVLAFFIEQLRVIIKATLKPLVRL